MARPKKYKIDTVQLQKLATLGCTNKEMGDFFGCSADLLEKSYSEFLTKGRAEQKMRLRQLQWRACENGNVSMLIFLGKNMLGQQDRLEESASEEPLPWTN